MQHSTVWGVLCATVEGHTTRHVASGHSEAGPPRSKMSGYWVQAQDTRLPHLWTAVSISHRPLIQDPISSPSNNVPPTKQKVQTRLVPFRPCSFLHRWHARVGCG